MPHNELLVDVLRGNIGFLKMHLNDMSDARPDSAAGADSQQWALAVGATGCRRGSDDERLRRANHQRATGGICRRYTRETASSNDPAKLGNKADLVSLTRESSRKHLQMGRHAFI